MQVTDIASRVRLVGLLGRGVSAIHKLRKLSILLIPIFVALAWQASASPLTFYYDEASWLAAFPGSIVGTGGGPLAGSTVTTTVKTFADSTCCAVLGSFVGGGR
jgi:hypothetical protein